MTILLNILKNNWQYVMIVLLLVAIVLGGRFASNLLDENKRLRDNVEQSMLELPSKVMTMTAKEFNKYRAHNDSLYVQLKDSLKLRDRKITRVVNNKYYNTYEAVVPLVPDETDSTFKTFNYVFDPCASVSGKVNWNENLLIFDPGLKIDYNSTSIYFQKRKHNWWFLHFGRKKQWVETINNCTGETKVTDITFEK